MVGAADAARPRIAVVHDPRSTAALQLREVAGAAFDFIWVIDSTLRPAPVEPVDLLRRLGSVVDIAGLDVPAAAAAVAELEPDGIVTFADRRITATAALAEALALPYHSRSTALALSSKAEQRRRLAAGGLVVPRHWRVPPHLDRDEISALLASVVYPLICKPDSGDGSRYITRVDQARELGACIAEGRAAGRDVILEELIGGLPRVVGGFADYVSVESVVSHGVVSHVAVNGRFPLAEPFRESGFFIPACLDAGAVASVLDCATSAIASLGVTDSCLHTEIKLTDDGPRVIEMNGRLGGGVPEMLELVSDVNLFEVACRVAAGEPIAFDGLAPCTGVAYLFYVQAPAGPARRVASIDGLDVLAAHNGIETVRVNRAPGSIVDAREGNFGHVYSVLGRARDHDDLLETERMIFDKVTITYEGRAHS